MATTSISGYLPNFSFRFSAACLLSSIMIVFILRFFCQIKSLILSGITIVATHPTFFPHFCSLLSEKVILLLFRSLTMAMVWVITLSPVRFFPTLRISNGTIVLDLDAGCFFFLVYLDVNRLMTIPSLQPMHEGILHKYLNEHGRNAHLSASTALV